MKSFILRKTFAVLLLFGLILSCQKEANDIYEIDDNLINEARLWYETNLIPEKISDSKSLTSRILKTAPNWDHAFSNKHKDFKTVEVPLEAKESFGFSTGENYMTYKETGDERFLNSKTTLVILRKGNMTSGFLMTVIPEKNHLVESNFDPTTPSYMKWANCFSGFILYYNLDRSFSNGWRFVNGKVIEKVFFKGENLPLSLSKSCTEYYFVVHIKTCDVSYGDVNAKGTKGCTHEEYWNYLFTVCDGGGGGGEGGSGGGAGGGYTPPPERPCEGDPVINMRIAPSIISGINGGMFGCVRLGGTDCDSTLKFHDGIDIACPLNTNIYAMKGGEVIGVVDTLKPGEQDSKNPLGNYVKVRHTAEDGSTQDFYYGHLNAVYVKKGDFINSTHYLGLSGNTGNAGGASASEPHVHIKVRQDGSIKDPAGYFRSYISPSGEIIDQCTLSGPSY